MSQLFDAAEAEVSSHAMADAVREPLLVLDGDLRIRLANSAFRRAFGLGPSGGEGQSLFALSQGRWDQPPLRGFLAEALSRRDEPEGLRLDLPSPDGGARAWFARARRLDGPDPRQPRLVLEFEDIAGKEKDARDLEEARDRLRLILESVRDFAIFTLDPKGKATSWNKGAENIFQWSADEVMGQTLDRLFVPEDRAQDAPAQELRTAAERGQAMDERWHLRKDGSRFFASGVVTSVRDASGRIIQFIKVARDVTERIRYEEQLEAGKERMDLLLDSTLEGIYGIDREGRCIFANAGCVRILGFRDREDVLGRDAHALFHHSHPDGSPFPREACAIHHDCTEGAESGEAKEATFWRADAAPLPVEYRCRSMRKDGQVVGAVVTFLDISERKRMEERLQRAEAQRFEARKMEAIGRLAGGVAHEFNNSLTAINGYADLLLRITPEGDPRKQGLEEIRNAGEKAAAVTQHLLTFGRRQILQPRPIDLSGMIGSLAKLLAKVVGDGAELRLALAPDLAPVSVDPRLMEQAIVGLTMNSREALESGGSVTLETRNLDLPEEIAGVNQMIPPGRYVLLAHADTGRGIPGDILEKVFDPFYSTKSMGSRAIGMGLASLYGFVRQSGGYLQVESAVGRGTRFSIFLPPSGPGTASRAGEGDPQGEAG